MYLYLLTRDLNRGGFESHTIVFGVFFHEGDIFKYHYCLNKTFYHIFVIF